MNGTILELTFQNDQRVLHDGSSCRVVGSLLSPPHWTTGMSKAVSFSPHTVMSVQVKIQVSPAHTAFKLVGINRKHQALNFESGSLVASPSPQLVTLRSKAPLPPHLSVLSDYITWNIVPIGGRPEGTSIGQTGEHIIYITFGTPITKNSMGYPNVMTVPRMDFIYDAIQPGDNVSEASKVASIVQIAVNHLPNIGHGTPNVAYGSSESADVLWSFADSGTSAQGHCGEAGYLMEEALRMIGISALQKHVYARSDKESLHAGLNVVYEDEASHKTIGTTVNPQKRNCNKHGEETLRLWFASANAGEGTVDVGGKLYTGLITDVGEAHGGITAAHDVLLKLQNKHRVYQIWNSDQFGPCTLSPAESGAGVARPPVPPA